MRKCSRCNKRPAVIFINEIKGDKVTSKGLCFHCAKELNIKPFSDYIEKMGIREEDMDTLEQQMSQMLGAVEDGEEGVLPGDLGSLFGGAMMPVSEEESEEPDEKDQKDSSKKKKKKHGKILDGYCINLTKRASEGKLDPVIGRDVELQRVIQILCRRQKNNPCLIGEPGVGKTAIAELLAQSIVSKNVPVRLRDKEVFLLDLTALVAGTHFRGQFESRVKSLVDEVKKLGNIIFYVVDFIPHRACCIYCKNNIYFI